MRWQCARTSTSLAGERLQKANKLTFIVTAGVGSGARAAQHASSQDLQHLRCNREQVRCITSMLLCRPRRPPRGSRQQLDSGRDHRQRHQTSMKSFSTFVSIQYCRVYIMRASNTDSVAEHEIMLSLILLRNFIQGRRMPAHTH
jgi:lactate dehydrogenase-like 2-hydroxyacid dehydrogenase